MKCKTKKRIKIVVFIIFIVIIYVLSCASRALYSIGKAFYEAEMSTASYDAIDKVLSDEYFKDVYELVKNDYGDIVAITTDNLKVNKLTKTLAKECLDSYEKICDDGVNVPMGAFTGIALLSGEGRHVNVNMVAIKSVKCEFYGKYESVGINQTRQAIYLKIVPDCKIVVGFKRANLECEIEVLCYENLVLGKVPDTYVTFGGFTVKSQ